MKPFEYYSDTKTLFPNKRDYITYYVYDKGQCLCECRFYEIYKERLKEIYPNAVIQENLDIEAYKAHQKEYKDEINKLQEEFKNDLFQAYGVKNNPKSDLLFYKVKDMRVDYSEIYDLFGDLVELIEELK